MPSAALAALVTAASAAGAAVPAARPPDPALVEVAEESPGLRLDLRYATSENFLREAVYPCARCLLRRPTAQALVRAQSALAAKGLALVVWDCYRPPAVQRRMWALVPDPRYVADPAQGSVHNRGGAVDVTLATADGKPLPMPTAFDAFTPAAAADAPTSAEAARNRATLREAMEAAGFERLPTEWWHFDLAGSRDWPVVDAPLCSGSPGDSPRRSRGATGR